jgi:hypothetical protein
VIPDEDTAGASKLHVYGAEADGSEVAVHQQTNDAKHQAHEAAIKVAYRMDGANNDDVAAAPIVVVSDPVQHVSYVICNLNLSNTVVNVYAHAIVCGLQMADVKHITVLAAAHFWPNKGHESSSHVSLLNTDYKQAKIEESSTTSLAATTLIKDAFLVALSTFLNVAKIPTAICIQRGYRKYCRRIVTVLSSSSSLLLSLLSLLLLCHVSSNHSHSLLPLLLPLLRRDICQ